MPDAEGDRQRGKSTRFEVVKVLSFDYFKPKPVIERDQNEEFKLKVCESFTLNKEQTRAFRIVADHASSKQPTTLKMYLGGMGGSGKSQVIRAITAFFQLRGESYRFMILGPTGSTAALINGSTYHSVFKVPRDTIKKGNKADIDGIRNEATAMAGVNERIQGVEYIFLDEISMVSC
ncbi:hypothetical protein C8R46DRAFT_924037, partial [Mycena filopes]